MKLKFYFDSGHGWIAVKRSIAKLYLDLSQVSTCSYQSQSGQTLYLEEDMDAGLLIRGIENSMVTDVRVLFEEKDCGDRSWIRSLPSFSL